MISEQTLEMVSTEKVGLVAHFFPVLTSYVLLSLKNNIWTNIMFYSSLAVFIFTVSYLYSLRITTGKKYNLKITKGFRDDSLEKFGLKTMPLPYRTIFAIISVIFLVLYIWTVLYSIINYHLNKNLLFIIIVIQISISIIYLLMLFFTRRFLKIFYPKKGDLEKAIKNK